MKQLHSWYRLDRHDEPDPAPDVVPDPAPASDPPTPPGLDPSEPVDMTVLPANVRKLIADLRKETGGHRQKATAAEQAATAAQQQRDAVLAALGVKSDGSEVDDPEARAVELAQRVERAEAYAWTVGVKSDVYDLAAATGANPKLIYACNDFRDTLDDLTDDEPGTPEFRTAIEQKMREFVAANPEYAATTSTPSVAPPTPRPDRSQGRGASNDTPNFRTMPRAEVDAELAKFGFRQRS